MTNKSLMEMDNWDGFTGANAFLKPDEPRVEERAFVIIEASVVEDKETKKSRLRLTLESEKKHYTFDLNVTNAVFLENEGIKPKELVGKKLYFKVGEAMNPKIKKMGPSLRIKKVE